MSGRSSDSSRETLPLVEGSPEQRLLQTSKYVNVNSPWYLFFSNIALVFTTCIAVLPAMAFVTRNYHDFMPHCYELPMIHEVICSTFSYSFWSYPLICPVLACLIVRRRVLESRLYYECFLNGIHVDIEEDPGMNPMVWILLFWGVSSLGVIVYISSPFPLTAKAQYFLPIATFIIFVFTNWNINAYLITLPDFSSTDPEYASQMFQKASQAYVSEAQLRAAFENANDDLDCPGRVSSSTLSVPTMTSSRFFGKLRDAVDEEMKKFPATPANKPGCMDRILGVLGLVARTPWIERYPKISRPEVMSTCFSLRKGFWVSRILFNKHLSDARSTSFRRWFTAFDIFVFVLVAACIIAICHALSLFLVYEHYASQSSTVIWVLGSFGIGEKVVKAMET